MGDALGLRKYGCEVMIVTRFHTLYLTCINILLILQEHRVVNGVQRHIVEHLGTLHHQVLGTHLQVIIAGLQLFHCHHCFTTLLHGEEINHRRSLVLIVVECFHRHLGEECQGTL